MRRVLIGGSVVFVLALVAYVAVGIGTAPRLPEAPELDDVDVTAPAEAPRSKALHSALSSRYPAYEGLDGSYFSDHLDRIGQGAWLDNPDAALTMIGAASSLPTTVREALESPGCLRDESLDTDLVHAMAEGAMLPAAPPRDSANLVLLVRAIELMVIADVARAQRGETVPATRSLLQLLGDLRRLQQRCPNSGFVTSILQVCLALVHEGLGFLLASPEPEAGVWRAILELEGAEPDQQRAARQDIAEMREVRDRVFGHLDTQGETSRVLALLDRGDRRAVWLAGLPPSDGALRAPTVEEEHSRALQQRLPVFLLLTDAGESEAMFLVSSVLELQRMQILSRKRDHCRLAVQRAVWQRDLRARGRTLPQAASDSPPRDRLNDEVIDLGDGSRGHCGFGDARPIRAEDMARLPPYPPPT